MKTLQLWLILGGIAFGGVGIGMALTNPSPEDYEEFAVGQLQEIMEQEGCDNLPKEFTGGIEIPEGLGNILQTQCPNIVEKASPILKRIITSSTQRQNFVILSIYRTDFSRNPVAGYLPADQFATVAVFNRFYLYQADKS